MIEPNRNGEVWVFAEQEDGNLDGYGNACDSDLTDNGVVDLGDLSGVLTNLGSTTTPTIDLNCNGVVDDTLLLCDQNIATNTANALDFARAIDICQTATDQDKKWGVISGALTFPPYTLGLMNGLLEVAPVQRRASRRSPSPASFSSSGL